MNEQNTSAVVCQTTNLMNLLIGKSNQVAQELNRKMMDELSLSLAKYEVLAAVNSSDNGEITMSNLSRELNVSNANMTGMTSRLQSDGFLIKRSLPSDRRIFSVVLTEEGQDILAKAAKKYAELAREILSNLEDGMITDLTNFLQKVGKN